MKKFRAWNTIDKQMYLPDTTDWDELHILLNGETQSAQHSGYYQTVSVFNRDDIELMQYIGKVDKEGTEIYEGDVLICSDDEGDVMLIQYTASVCGFVAYRFGHRQYTGENSQDVIEEGRFDLGVEDDVIDNIHLYTIIGNIHQQPHLLNTIINQPK